MYLRDFTLTPGFFLGASLVLSATYLYGSDPSLLACGPVCCCPFGEQRKGLPSGAVYDDEEQEAMLEMIEDEEIS